MAEYITDQARLDFMIKEQAVIESVFEINDSRDGFVESGYQCIIDDGRMVTGRFRNHANTTGRDRLVDEGRGGPLTAGDFDAGLRASEIPRHQGLSTRTTGSRISRAGDEIVPDLRVLTHL